MWIGISLREIIIIDLSQCYRLQRLINWLKGFNRFMSCYKSRKPLRSKMKISSSLPTLRMPYSPLEPFRMKSQIYRFRNLRHFNMRILTNAINWNNKFLRKDKSSNIDLSSWSVMSKTSWLSFHTLVSIMIPNNKPKENLKIQAYSSRLTLKIIFQPLLSVKYLKGQSRRHNPRQK